MRISDWSSDVCSSDLRTTTGRLVRLDGVGIRRAAKAILSVLPLDSFVEQPVLRMEVVGRPGEIPPVQQEMQAEIDAAEGRPWPMGSIDRKGTRPNSSH